MVKIIIRQGDVLLKLIDKLPAGLSKKNNILAYGEVTGHNHKFQESAQVEVMKNQNGDQFVSVSAPSVLVHEEHAAQVIPIGMYEVVIQRELDLMGQMRNVRD